MYVHFFKRLFDLIIAILALPLILLLIAILGPIIYFEDKGPVFYNAPRVGKDGKEFIMYKFRSMKVNAPDLTMADGSTYNGADDPRMTKHRRVHAPHKPDEFLSSSSLDRNMSVIGPRPDLKRNRALRRQRRRKAGSSLYHRICRSVRTQFASWHDRLKMDVHVHNISFAFDVKIFLKTIATVFKQEGVYVEQEEKNEA
ncbi:MAG: sugar transferase [Slackia sp.]